MSVAKSPAKAPRPDADDTLSRARLEAAVRKAATTKAKAREAKAALKMAKKRFRVARKAAKAARKNLEALQAVTIRAEERAAAAKKARTKRAHETDVSRAAAKTTPPVPPRPARKTRRASPSARSGAEAVYTEPLATPADTFDDSSSATSS